MRYIIFLLYIAVTLASGVEVNLKQDANVSVLSEEIEVVKKAYEGTKSHLKIPRLKAYLSDNRILSNLYMQKYPAFNEEQEIKLKHMTEKYLAEKFIMEYQEENYQSDDIAKSYYILNQDDYMGPKRYDYTYFIFESFDEALQFYNAKKNDTDYLEKFSVTENNASVIPFVKQPEYSTYYTVVDAVKHSELPLLLPPQQIKKYEVILVRNVHEQQPIPYENVKKEIKDKLFQEALNKIRNEFMIAYEKKHQND